MEELQSHSKDEEKGRNTGDRTFFTLQGMKDIISGAAFLGAGGGGSIDSAATLLDTISSLTTQVEYRDPTDLGDEENIVVLAALGSPLAFKESPFVKSPRRSLQLLEKAFRTGFVGEQSKPDPTFSFSCVMSGEVGPLDPMTCMLVAAQLNIAIVDADGAGRAVPKLQMTTLAMDNVSPAPATICSETEVADGGATGLLNVKDAKSMDELCRDMVGAPSFGELSAMSLFTMTGKVLNEAAIPNTLTKARDLGRLIREAGPSGAVQAVVKQLKGYVLVTGVVTDMGQTTSGGFDVGTVVVKSSDAEETVTIKELNENMIAWSDRRDHPLVLAPDLVSYIDDKGRALTNADLKKGQEITVIGTPCVPQLRNQYFIDLFADVYRSDGFGYFGDYVPIEELNG